MRFSFLALTPVKLISPGRKSRALLSKLMKSLADEYGPGKSAMNPKRFAASFDYRSEYAPNWTSCGGLNVNDGGQSFTVFTASLYRSACWILYDRRGFYICLGAFSGFALS
jgi:hypothetical protein